MSEKNFGFLGASFQQTLIKSIIEDKKYGEQIIDVIDSKYFDNSSFRFITAHIKEYYHFLLTCRLYLGQTCLFFLIVFPSFYFIQNFIFLN